MSNNDTRITALEARCDSMDAKLDRLIAFQEARLPVATVTPKAKKAKKAPKATGTPFPVLRAALKAHKAAGAIPAGVSVRDAVAGGLMLADGSLPGKQVAQVKAEAPAKERKPVGENHASQGPRDALGRITPKAEWATREALADTGKFGRDEIDLIVASQR